MAELIRSGMLYFMTQKISKVLACLLLAAIAMPFATASRAHTPHDTIDALTVDTSQQNAAVFVVRAGRHLLRSYDGGASWKELVNGIDSRYTITSLQLAQYGGNVKRLYMATDGDGVYVSSDSGSSWSKDNAGLDSLRIQKLAAEAADDNSALLLAADKQGGLFRKEGGETKWQRVLDKRVKVTAIAFRKHQGELSVLIGDDIGNVHVSADNGSSWKKLISIKNAGTINSIVVAKPGSDKPLIFVGTEKKAVLHSVDGGASFIEPDAWRFDKNVITIAVSPEFDGDATLYASTWHEALLESKDGGRTWKKHDDGLSTHPQADLPAFYSPYFRYISIDAARDEMYLAGFDGLFKSADQGHSWRQVATEPVGNIWELSLSPAMQGDFVVAVTTFDAGVYTARSSDLNWSINNQGLLSTRLRKLVFSPNFANDATVFSSEDEGDNLLKSTNGGDSWNTVNLYPGFYIYWKRKILAALRYRGAPAWMTTDLLTKEDRIRANPKGLVLSPSFATDNYLYIATRYRGNFESTDAGQSLDQAEESPLQIWDLAISPNFTADKTLFASSRESGVYKSNDAGKSWRAINSGLDFLKVWQQQAAADKDFMTAELGRSKYYDILLAVSPSYNNDKTLFAAGGEGIFKSSDGGETWQQSGHASLSGHYVFAIAVSPDYANDQTVVVSVKGKGLFKSADGGATFSELGERLLADNHEMRHIAFSPMYPSDRTLYAVSLEDLFRSTDDGASWQLVERPIRYESHKYDVIDYQGEWEKVRNDSYSARWANLSKSSASSVTFPFVGTGVKWIGAKGQNLGQGDIYLDGKRLTSVSQHSENAATASITHEIENLPYQPHELMIKVASGENANTGSGILIDAFDVIGNRELDE